MLGYGIGIQYFGSKGGVSDIADGGLLSSTFLSRYGPYGMVMDFTDASITIDGSTDVLDYSSQGTVSSTTGALLGPGSKLTYTAPSVKLTEQADGYLAFQAHNLCTYSEDFSNANWSKANSGGLTATLSAEAPASGTATVYKLIPNAVSGYHNARNTASTVSTSGSLYYSAEVKADGYSKIGFREDFVAGTYYANFDLSAVSVINSAGTGVSATIVDIGGGWRRISFVVSNTSGQGLSIYVLQDSFSSGDTAPANTYTGNGTSGILATRVHIRRLPSVSTYVATTSAAVYDLPYVYSAGVKTGLFPEPAATNLCLRSNDFTNASWTKSNMTTSLTATGPDGVANSASTLTATAGNATALQAITSGSSSRLTHCYIKRRTGSGNIDLTQDNGSTWTTVTVTSAWTRVQIAAVTSTNPTVGIRIVTSGDAVDVTYFQHETGTVATSPIITYGSSVVRAVDTDTSLLNLFPSIGSAYTAYIRFKPASASVATTALRLDDTTANELVSIGNNASGQGLATVTDGGVSQASITDGTITSSAFHRLAVSVEANNVLFVVNGGTGVQDASVTLPTLTRMLLGNTSGQLITQIALFPGARTEAQLQAIGA